MTETEKLPGDSIQYCGDPCEAPENCEVPENKDRKKKIL
jgi:hypothetical protein